MGGLRSKSQAIVHHWDSSFVSWIKNNYLNIHLNFRWKIIGGSKVQKLVQNDQLVKSNKSRQEQQLSFIVYGHNICPSVYHHKCVIIFNRWNIWTFGSKKFREKLSPCQIIRIKDTLPNIRDSKVQGKRSLIISAIRSNISCYSYNQYITTTLVIDLLFAETDPILGKQNPFIHSNDANNLDAIYSIYTFSGTINNMGKGTKKSQAPAKSSTRTAKKISDEFQGNSVEYHEDEALDGESNFPDDVMVVEVQTSSQLKSVLRSIKQTANGVVSSRQEIALLTDRLSSVDDAGIRLQLDLERTTESELYNLLDFRSDAQEIASVDNIVLSEEQLRSDV